MATKTKEDIWVQVRIANPKKAGIFNLGEYKDETGKKRILKDANGNEMRVKLNGNGKTVYRYNLSNPNDARVIEHLRDHPVFVKRPNPLLIIEDENARAEERLAYEEAVYDAKGIIKELMGSDLANFARIFGIPTDNSSEKTVRLALIEFAELDPERVISEWNSEDREYKEILRRGMSKGVFNVDDKGVWKYNEILMGTSFEQALEWMKNPKNEDLVPTIRGEVKKI